MTEVLASPVARALGVALLQFLWQGALIGACTAVALIVLRRRTAVARYAVACVGLSAMIVMPVVTGTTFKTHVQVGPNETLNGTVSLQLGAMTEMIEVRGRPPASAQSAPPRDRPAPAGVPPAAPPASAVPMVSPFSAGPPPTTTGPIRVGGDIREPKRTNYVEPVYPGGALAARVEGYVIIEGVIGKDGTMTHTRILTSHPMFDDAAVGAVRQWTYTPAALNGEPTEIVTIVTVMFKLMQ